MKNKKIFILILVLIVLLLTACRGNELEISELLNKAYNDDGNIIIPEGYVLLEIYGKDGEVIIDSMCVKYKKNLSVADISRGVCRYKNIPIVFSGMGTMLYVQGINNLFEFDHGAGSGWLYSVNGEYQSESCGGYVLEDCNYVEWRYTLDLGKDLNAFKLIE